MDFWTFLVNVNETRIIDRNTAQVFGVISITDVSCQFTQFVCKRKIHNHLAAAHHGNVNLTTTIGEGNNAELTLKCERIKLYLQADPYFPSEPAPA